MNSIEILTMDKRNITHVGAYITNHSIKVVADLLSLATDQVIM